MRARSSRPFTLFAMFALALGLIAPVVQTPAVLAQPVNICIVLNTNDSGIDSFREALSDPACTEIIFDLPAGPNTIQLETPLPPVTGTVSIIGPGASNLTLTRNTSFSTMRILTIAAGADVSVSGLTISGGVADGIDALGSGGGIYNEGTLSLTESAIISNAAATSGGGVYNAGAESSLTITDSVIDLNDSPNGGGIYNAGGGQIIMINSAAHLNTGARGGAIYNTGPGSRVEMTGGTIVQNQVTEQGGAIHNVDGGEVLLTGVEVSGNTATAQGGAIYIAGADSVVTITNSTITGNTSSSFAGGGMFISSGAHATITGSEISQNSSLGSGGGIYITGNSSLDLIDSTIAGNESHNSDGGAMRAFDSTVVITGSTITGNTAATSGGIIGVVGSNITITSSTIYNNPASYEVTAGDTAVVTLTASIVASSTGVACNGVFASGGYNLTSDSVGSCFPDDGTNLFDADPLLHNLADNSGPTETFLPQPSSPAINAIPADICATLPETDQRGATRPAADSDLCDIGAVEGQFATLATQGDIELPATGADGRTVTITATASDWLETPDISISCTTDTPDVGPFTPPDDILFPVGTTIVSCETDGASDYETSDSFSVTIVLPNAPTMEQPANINETSGSPAGLAVDYAQPAATDFNGDPLAVTCTPPSGSLFPLGETTVTCVSEPDMFDRVAERTFTVNVRPAVSLAPTFTSMPTSVIPTSNPSGTTVTYAPNVSSPIDDAPTIVCTPPSGSFFSIGTHTITCTATDQYGLATTMSFQIIITFDDGSTPPPPPPTDPGEPGEPQEPTDPEEPGEPQEPTDPGAPEEPTWDASAFDDVWARTDLPVANGSVSRTWVWGPQPFSTLQEVPTERWEDYVEAPGGKRLVRYYDKARMEITDPDAPDSPWYVTNGLLVVELITGMMQVGDDTFIERSPADVAIAGDLDDPDSPTYADLADLLDPVENRVGEIITERLNGEGDPAYEVEYAFYDEVTGHNIAAPFWAFMNSSGPVWVDDNLTEDLLFENPFYGTGRPVTEAYWVTVDVGGTPHEVLLQCFERRCLTYTPENDPGWQVEAGNVGLHYFIWRYGK